MFWSCVYPPHSHPSYRFVDRDAFARFVGIGVGCQRLQATRILEIVIGPDAPDPANPPDTMGGLDGLFAGCYKIDDDDDD